MSRELDEANAHAYALRKPLIDKQNAAAEEYASACEGARKADVLASFHAGVAWERLRVLYDFMLPRD